MVDPTKVIPNDFKPFDIMSDSGEVEIKSEYVRRVLRMGLFLTKDHRYLLRLPHSSTIFTAAKAFFLTHIL